MSPLVLAMVSILLVTSPVAAISCYRGTTTSLVTDCNRLTLTTGPGVGTWGVLLGEILRGVIGDDFLANFVAHLQNSLNLRLGSQQSTAWVKTTLKNLQYDVEDNCYVAYETSSGITTERGCGAGGDLLQYMQETPYVFWTNSVCFSRPGFTGQEVCLCSQDGCNRDYTSARTAANIAIASKSVVCGSQPCPLADLSKVAVGLGEIDTGCYTAPGSTTEHCFTTEGIFDPAAVAAARTTIASTTSSTSFTTDSGYKFSRVNGKEPTCFMCGLIDLGNRVPVIPTTQKTVVPPTPDPYISMEIGNWKSPGQNPEFPGAGAQASHKSTWLLLLLLLLL